MSLSVVMDTIGTKNSLVCLCILGHNNHPRFQCGEGYLEAVHLGYLPVHEVQPFRMFFHHCRKLS